MSNKRKIVFILFFIVILGLFYALGNQIYDSLNSGDRLEKETEALMKLQKKNLDLKNKLREVQSMGFIEKEARNKLNLAREGETVMILSQEKIEEILRAEKKQLEEPKIPNWQGWLRLFWR